MFRPETLIGRFGDVDVLVVGDALLDCWLAGSSSRLCREAPVPVVTVDRRTYAPGGAANAAANVAALDGRVRFASVVGDDREGGRLREELAGRGVGVDAVVEVAGRRTPAKRRVVADRQM